MNKEPKLPSVTYVIVAFMVYVGMGIFFSAGANFLAGAH